MFQFELRRWLQGSMDVKLSTLGLPARADVQR